MNFLTVLLALAMTSASAVEPLSNSEPAQSQASFEAAIRNSYSTAPSYVLVEVVDARTESTRSTCTTVNLLLGAIRREYDLGSDKAGVSKAIEIAQSNKTHVFRFAKEDALNNIPVKYSNSDLVGIRAQLAPLSTDELRAGFARAGKLHALYRNDASRDAVACVLIERGLSPGMGDRVPILWLAPSMSPVWQNVNSRYSQAELFQKIMRLASQPLITPEEVKTTFGIDFEPPHPDNPDPTKSWNLVYNTRGDTAGRFGIDTFGFSFSYRVNAGWVLNLSGFSRNLQGPSCVLFGDALKTILSMGWREEDAMAPHRLEFVYRKESESLSSRIWIGNRRRIKANDCLDAIQISNGLNLANRSKE